MEPMTLVKALMHYFEIPLSKFRAEFNSLTDKDKEDFRTMLEGEGYTLKS